MAVRSFLRDRSRGHADAKGMKKVEGLPGNLEDEGSGVSDDFAGDGIEHGDGTGCSAPGGAQRQAAGHG